MSIRTILVVALAFQAVLRAQSPADPVAGYQLNPLDKLTVAVEQDPAPGKPVEVAVSSLFNIDVPVSRCCETTISINVRGKTVADVQNELKAKLEEKYYNTATVSLKLVDRDLSRRVGQVWLRGAVRGNVAPLEAGKRKTLWEVLTQVGTTEFARLSKVRVDRLNQATGETKTFNVNIEAVNKGDRSQDLELEDGDRITVSEKWFNF
jgi:protein involved in polysaccharide export with SLBB domain